jgi:hypothetical protein
MSKERVDRYKCDACGDTKELQPGWLGSKRPPNWGIDYKEHKTEMCDDCFSDYEKEYKSWFSTWLNGRRKKK